jgi:hypothetical protein
VGGGHLSKLLCCSIMEMARDIGRLPLASVHRFNRLFAEGVFVLISLYHFTAEAYRRKFLVMIEPM